MMVRYHDEEWGVPVHDEGRIFEFLVLEAMQAGLSWRTVLHKRENFSQAFAGFDAGKVARFDDRDVKRLMEDAGIIRNRRKIEAAIENARRFIQVQEECGSFSEYMWGFVGGQPVQNRFRRPEDVPATSPVSDAWSRDMKKRGFRFIGSTVLYAHMQAVGMVNDHLVDCFRYKQVLELATQKDRK